ncbi:hypothetical protein [uncultured Microbacterium sp.]|uniref:hypothetical protein n=1 Tax=uncultured Microbacterium sp. TaxID=191216 RepID=UPI0035CAEFF2
MPAAGWTFDDFDHLVVRDYRTPWAGDEYGRQIVSDAEEWAHLLGRQLFDFTAGRPLPGRVEGGMVLAEYHAWNRESFVRTVRALQLSLRHRDAIRRMHFHTLANCLLRMWRPVFGFPGTPTVIDRRQAQLLLAIHAANMMTTREVNLRGGNVPTPGDKDEQTLLDAQHGMLTETDAAVTILEIIRDMPHVILLPAPPQFESGPSRHNVDFLLLDVSRRAAVGIQVKTKMSQSTPRNYDEGVVFVDGTIDLGNERLATRSRRGSTLVRKAWPGLISGHLLMRANERTPVNRPWADVIVARREGLRESLHGTTDYLARAVQHVRPRLLAALERPEARLD